jgi:formylglycine-generating enzyme required for sulfatase activity
MKQTILYPIIPLLLAASIGCDDGGGNSMPLIGGGGAPSAGDTVKYEADGIVFTLVYVPGGKTVPLMTDDSLKYTIKEAFWIGETEVTYAVWQKVYDWATSPARGADRYYFANPGLRGNDGNPGKTARHPVTTVNWCDAVVFCNALTEWYNGNNMEGVSYTCAYRHDGSVIRDAQDANEDAFQLLEPGSAATGFRLPSSYERELAARWSTGGVNTVSGYSNPFFTRGNSASGAYTFYKDAADTTPANGVVDGKEANDLVAVYGKYWNGTAWVTTGTAGTAEVKSRGIDGANSLGLYDMSGNVGEWSGTVGLVIGYRRVHGGSCFMDTTYLQVGNWIDREVMNEYNDAGFRLARPAR